jgi:hypothetical protein
MTPEDRMVASAMARIANDPGWYQLFTNIQHGNFDAAASPLYVVSKGIDQARKFLSQIVPGALKPLKMIPGSGARQQIMRQVVKNLADHSSSMGTVSTMLIGQGVNRHRDTINLMASIGPERMAQMVKADGLEPKAMGAMASSMAALSIYNDILLLPFKLFSPNEIYDGSDISMASQTFKSALTAAAEMGAHVQAPGSQAPVPSTISHNLTPIQEKAMALLTQALQVSPKDLGIHEDDSRHPEVQEFMDRMAHHAFDTMRKDPDQMAQILNAMFNQSPRMKGVALAALPRGNNSGLLDSLSWLEATSQKPALQAMACLIRPMGARARDVMAGSSGIRFNVKAAAQYLSSASENDQPVANQFVKAMNYAIDHGFVSNKELHKLHQQTDMDALIGHCLVQEGDDPQKDGASNRVGRKLRPLAGASERTINQDLMALIPKMMGSVAKHGKHPMRDLDRVFEQINLAVAGTMPGVVKSPSGSESAPDSTPENERLKNESEALKKHIVRQMQNHMVIPNDGEYQAYVLGANDDQRATFTDAFGQALEARVHRFSETDALSPMDEKLGAMYRQLEEFQNHPNNIEVRIPGELYGTQPAHEPTVRDLFASHELDPHDVQYLLTSSTEAIDPGTSFSKTFNTMLNTRIRDVVYYNSPHHQLVRKELKACRQMVTKDKASFYRAVQEAMARHVGAQTSEDEKATI